MFEAHVLHLLRRYLGEYVHGLSAEALRISVWKGDVVLKDLRLKAEALNSLKLPVTVKAGFVGTITLKVPWKSLGKEPVIVLIDRVFVLAYPAPDERTLKEEDREKLFEAKLQKIEDTVSATLEAKANSKPGSPVTGNSWLGSLIGTIIGNLKISISNVHIRYEDSVSNADNPFSMGFTLAKLAAVTMDEQGNETFDASGALDKLRKSLQLERLAMYHDSNSLPWRINKKWESLIPNEWIEIFEDGINESTGDGRLSVWALNRSYLVSPINGDLKYHRVGKQEITDPGIPFENVSLVLSDVSLTITEAQYHDWIKLLEVISRYNTYVEVSHLRPVVPVPNGAKLWWHYAFQAVLYQRKMCYRFTWDQIRHLSQLRRRYVHLYASSLQELSDVNNSEIRNIEKDLDSKVIILWRLLAHAKAELVKSKEASRKKQRSGRWFSFSWQATSEESSHDGISEEPKLLEERLTKEEWQTINKLLSYQPDEELTLRSGKEMNNMIHFMVIVSIGQAAARIISRNQTEIICGRFEQLHVSTKFKHRSTHCDVLLNFYGLSAPEGSLAQSVCSEQKVHALAASFVLSPVGENVDWSLSATISPCHATILMESYDRVIEFMRRSNAVSPTVVIETATALQIKFEKVTRRAQEQFQMVLEQQSRFALDIDFDAPKVRVPIRRHAPSGCNVNFLLDLGHFTLQTKDSQCDDQRQSLYSHFYIHGRDISAFFTDSSSNCQNCTSVFPCYENVLNTSGVQRNDDNYYSLIDKCGMAVVVDQIKIPHPSYPSTRVSVQVPNLGFHFSPARYCRIMELLSIFYGTVESSIQFDMDSPQGDLAPWGPVDLASEAKILVWKGIGNSVAAWYPCFLVLSDSYLYVLESEKSQNYQRCSSMGGKQVYGVPPMNIGGSQFCIAVGTRGLDIQKVLESSTTLVIKFEEEEVNASWFKGLLHSTYRASPSLLLDVPEELSAGDCEFADPQVTNFKTADLVINGALVEAKVFIYGKVADVINEKLEETLIVDVSAGGAKVHIVRLDSDLTIKMKLHSLKIKDQLLGTLSAEHPQYLACSVLKNDNLYTSPRSMICDRESPVTNLDEDENFKDALPSFVTLSDRMIYSQNIDIVQGAKLGSSMECTKVSSPGVRDFSEEIFYEANDIDDSDFISVIFSTRNPVSSNYVGIDTEMSIRMSKLELFCNRPTVVALIGFGLDISSMNSGLSVTNTPNKLDDDSLVNKGKTEEICSPSVKGLLGYGKNRVVFLLIMNVDNVTVFLNKEDGSQLSMFVQERFILDLKVHPSSLSIEGTLGNLRLSDMSLGTDHCWGWLCDIRNPGAASLITFKFNSYSAEDDDYDGYDYSLSGCLSAVRIIFLYRFVQEIVAYFMELATPHTEEVIKLVDKVGDLEWWIQKSDIDGASALKLDLSLDTPLIIVPRNSTSKEFIQLDLGQLSIKNEFCWHGINEKDPSAVHLDVIHIEILGINMAVGVDGCVDKPMIQEVQGFDVIVQRSLRDVFRKVPTFSVEVKVGLLHVLMSEKEYKVILDCACMNLCEEPRLPSSFRSNPSGSKGTMRLLADKVNMNSLAFLSRTVTVVCIEVNYALLELCTGFQEVCPLAHLSLENLWVSYRMTSLSESDLYVTIPRFSVLDIRIDTKPEMHLMLGSSIDAFGQTSAGNTPFTLNMDETARSKPHASTCMDIPNSTMFLMDYRLRSLSKSFVVRIQQSRVLVVLDFLLAVGEFFVPALGTITGREELMDPNNDPIFMNKNIVLSQPVYKQKNDVLHLSPIRQLVADNFEVHEYTYDGCGKTICLSEETGLKEHSSRSRPIIIVGRNKRLRFVNVKIENGSLLKKYMYLNNGSSYSVSFDDGVDISFLNNSTSDNEKPDIESLEESSMISSSVDPQSDSTKMLSYTIEAQVVSPEFIFYDGTKSSQIESSHDEKFLRAKMDLNFMYASKETDTWIRALVKDLTVEAGSGLVILDPVDISGEYTFVRDRSNISLTLTNVCIRLPLSAIALVLTLQSQAAEALQFGIANPLSSCINFDCIWVCPKESGSCSNLTFWRPQAPSNYVILGDCVTSREVPPSQAVMAVCTIYGRVRKPLGFKLIGSFSNILGLKSKSHPDCSLWMPIPPPGYSVVGCVAYPGTQPPPNHIVYCLRSDLVTSTTHSECIFSPPSCPVFQSGISIWRLDNVLGSFYAHLSNFSPPKDSICDLSFLLLWSSCHDHSSSKHGTTSQSVNSETASYSGWDVIRSISRATSSCTSTHNFERIWFDKGSDGRRAVSIWRPIPRVGYGILGDYITEGFEQPALAIVFKHDDPELSANPVQFTKVAQNMGKGFDDAFFWYPVAPPGYVSFGCVVSVTDEAPPTEIFCCPRMDLVIQANILEVPISRSSSSKVSNCWSLWQVENMAGTFLARADSKTPSRRLAYGIGDYVKPKARENISAVVKLCYLSFTILDSLCGMMTPLFDITITNIKLATHGRPEAINAALIASIAASTFNTQLEAWEPLVEPFNGIFKLETFDTNEHEASSLGKRIHIAATNVLNINLSAANLDTLAQTTVSWRKQIEIEKKTSMRNLVQDCSAHCIDGDDSSFPPLDQDGYQSIIIDNKLGCDIHVKKLEQISDSVLLVHHDDHASVWIPPPRFSDKVNIAVDSRETQYYVSVQIFQAKGLCIVDDGSNHNFFCTIRLVVDNRATDQKNIFPQSARTKSVKPAISNISDFHEGDVKWNELFIFEVPRKGKAMLEVEVTNLAANAGKGDVVGSFSFPIGCGESMLKKVPSARMMHPQFDVQNVVSFSLRGKDQCGNDEDIHDSGCLLVSTSYFERKMPATFQRRARGDVRVEQELGFWLGLAAEGKWQSVRSILPVSVIPKFLEDDFIAMEVIMRNGKKRVIFRGLATVVNESDINLDIAVCRASMFNYDLHPKNSTENTVVEEIFENQRYQPISGWGSNSPGLRSNEPERWSSRDFSYSSKDFMEPDLSSGWKWTSSWIIDKSASVDRDGWAYGVDYQTLKWPPTSARSCTKSATDTVRRRRWIRTRQTITEPGIHVRNNVLPLSAGSSAVLPWKCISKISDQCLQVRPPSDYSEAPFSWSDVVGVDAGSFGKDQSVIEGSSIPMQSNMKHGNEIPFSIFKLNQLEKKDVLMLCRTNNKTREFWLSVCVDAAVLHSELNAPVYDWKISINSPFMLENRLPCSAEFTIWEMKGDVTKVERQHGIISSRMSVHIYSVNIQRPIYLTLFVQGGWVLEKDPVLVLDLFSQNHASSFWMVHQGSKRRLCVSIERDMGGTHSAPKAIKFFVPYWIANDSFLSLAYQMVEIDPSENTDVDPLSFSRSMKSAKMTHKNATNPVDRNNYGLRKVMQVLEIIVDTTPIPSMLSLQDYTRKLRAMQISRNDIYLPPRIGISVAIHPSENYSSGISLLDLENKERVDVRAFNCDGSYYKLSAILNMTSDRTKVIRFQPHTLFINRVGCNLCLRQYDTYPIEWIHPTDTPKPFAWQSSTKSELLKIQLDGYKWSAPFSLGAEGLMRIPLNSNIGTDQTYVRVEVRSGAKSSQYEVIFRPNSLSSPYRVVNCSMFLPICFRQVGGCSNSWQSLPPNSAASFFWEDLGRLRLLELLLDGSDPSKSEKYDIDENSEHQAVFMACGSARALRIIIRKEEKVNVVRVSDCVPNDVATVRMGKRPSVLQHSGNDSQPLQTLHSSSSEFHLNVELTELGISIIDHTPEEILYFFVHDFLLSYSTGLVSQICRLKLKMHGIQVDNQLPLTPTPVLFRPQRSGEQTENNLELSITMQSNGSLDLCVYPSISLHGPENSAFLINIHEPIIWRLHEMIQNVNLIRLFDTQTTAVSVDPIIQIGVISISEIRLKVSMAMSPSQRPTGVLGFWASLMTAVGNTENMPVRIRQRFHENTCMRRSTLINHAISSVQKDLLSQPLQLLSGVDILGNASSALGHMSKGVAALSLDKKFIQSRQRQENKGVEDIGDVIREGGGALAKGIFRGVTGILTKPLEGAKNSGVEGFVQGVGKGIIGAAAQPVSGVLDLLSKTTEGANAMRMKIASAITSEEQLLRKRFPRVIGGDNLLRPYDEYKAQGQVILQLAESGSFFGQVDLFKVRGKFALTDSYEDHFALPKGKILVVTHRRVMLLQQPTNIVGQRKFSPVRDRCSVLWDVSWNGFVTMELSHGKNDRPKSPPSQLIIYLQSRSMEHKDQLRIVKCFPESNQAFQIYASIDRAINTYASHQSKEMMKREVTKPYAPAIDDDGFGESIPKERACI